VLFVGVDWAEDHHDLCVMAEDGTVLAKRRVPDSAAGIGELHGLIAEQVDDDQPVVVVGIEIDKGLVVWSLLAAGYEVYAINPMASARYRDRHATSGAKSDPGDAKVLADLVRTDRHNHRPIAGDSDLVEGVKVLARRCASTTPGPWRPSAPIWPAPMPWLS
jgi:transposase